MELDLNLMDLVMWAQYRPPPGRNTGPGGAALGAPFFVCCCSFGIPLLTTLPMLIGMWKVFEKAGKPGWAALVPIYNAMVMAEIARKDPVYGLLTLIPVVGMIFMVILLIEMCKEFDVGQGFAIGLILVGPIFWPIMGFGKARYIGGGRRRRRRPAYDDEYEEEERPRRRSDNIRRDEEED